MSRMYPNNLLCYNNLTFKYCNNLSCSCSINLQDHQRGALQWFYNAGLGGFNGKKAGTDWQFYTFGTFLTQFGEEGVRCIY